MDPQEFDYIIIGAGAAGLSAGQYGARAGLRTIILDTSTGGGQALQIAELENYPGVYPPVNGADFAINMIKQTKAFGVEILQANVISVDKVKRNFFVKTSKGIFSSLALLIATGATHNTLGIPGESELVGRGVSYCATCDGPFFKDKKIIVAGGGDSACTEAAYLSTISSDVTLGHRRATRGAQKAVADKVVKTGIAIRYNTKILEIRGKDRVGSVLLEDTQSGEKTELPTDAVFIFIGISPCTEIVSTLPADKNGYLITNESMETIVPGLYAAGDVRAKPFRQLITAASDGATAAHQAAKYIYDLKTSEKGSI